VKIHDISMTIKEDMQVYKNKPHKRPIISVDSNHETGASHESRMNINMHTGTHVDAPLHMVDRGEKLDVYSLDKFMGQARVLDFTDLVNRVITREDLEEKDIKASEIVLLKTANSYSSAFEFDFVYLSGQGAEYLAAIKVKTVGIDGLGIERDAPEHPAHLALLSKGIPIIEGLRLGNVEEGLYEFVGFPLKIEGVEAAPVRAVLIDRRK
tara:strand:- start:410 stop:1039 length:630 start_codon:yes stop_codon:yes gene_type:complete